MAKFSREVKIGFTVLVAVVLLIFGVNFLKGINLFSEQDSYFAVYTSVDGLGSTNPVVVNGLQIGMVKKRSFLSKNGNAVVVEFVINDKSIDIPKDSRAKIKDSDIFGGKTIELVLGNSSELALPGDTLQSEVEIGLTEAVRLELKPLKAKTDELIEGVDDIIDNLKAVFEDDATKGLPKAFESLQRTMETIERSSLRLDETIIENKSAIGAIFANIESISENLNSHNDQLSNIITNFSAISDTLAKVQISETILKADKAMEDFSGVMEKINSGEGTIGMLLNNDTLHTSLLNTNEELQFLINDLYLNPWRYVHVSIFGKKPDQKFSRKELKQLRNLIDEEIENQGDQTP